MLGIRKAKDKNLALLSSLSWRILQTLTLSVPLYSLLNIVKKEPHLSPIYVDQHPNRFEVLLQLPIMDN